MFIKFKAETAVSSTLAAWLVVALRMCVRWCRCSALGDIALIWGPTGTGIVAGQPAQYSSRYCRHTVRFRVNEMKRQKKTSFRGQSGPWLQEDSVRGGRVLGSISLHD